MTKYQIGDYLIYNDHEVEIYSTPYREREIYIVSWTDRYEGYQQRTVEGKELSPIPPDPIKARLIEAESRVRAIEAAYDTCAARHDYEGADVQRDLMHAALWGFWQAYKAERGKE